jgi:hypothetical protein
VSACSTPLSQAEPIVKTRNHEFWILIHGTTCRHGCLLIRLAASVEFCAQSTYRNGERNKRDSHLLSLSPDGLASLPRPTHAQRSKSPPQLAFQLTQKVVRGQRAARAGAAADAAQRGLLLRVTELPLPPAAASGTRR